MPISFVDMDVTLVDYMGTDDNVVDAARVSFHKSAEEYTEEQNDRLLSFLAREGHWSPFAHTALTVRCKVPLFLAAQLKKHQVGLTWNEVSRRYVTTELEFYNMETFHLVPSNKKQGRGDKLCAEEAISARCCYREACEEALVNYQHLMTHHDVCPEEARAVLPQATMTEFVWTGSLMAFVRVIQQRSNPGSQLIAQQFAALLHGEIKDIYPKAYAALLST